MSACATSTATDAVGEPSVPTTIVRYGIYPASRVPFICGWTSQRKKYVAGVERRHLVRHRLGPSIRSPTNSDSSADVVR